MTDDEARELATAAALLSTLPEHEARAWMRAAAFDAPLPTPEWVEHFGSGRVRAEFRGTVLWSDDDGMTWRWAMEPTSEEEA